MSETESSTGESHDASWRSTTALAEIAMWLRDCRRVVVLTHLKPDGDAIGSTLALVRALNLTNPFGGQRAEAWYFGPVPPWLDDVAGNTPHRVLTKESVPSHADPEAVIILDTGSWMQLDPVQEWLRKRQEVCAIIDHHVQGNAEVADLRVIETGAAAVCQPVAELCRVIMEARQLTELPREVATPLFLGIATDTGWFKHSNVNRAVLSTAGELIEAGAENVMLFQVVEQRDTPGRLRLLSRALASLELADEGRIAMMTLTKNDFAQSGAEPGDSGGFVDYTQGIPSVRVTVLLTEASTEDFGSPEGANNGSLTKISLRSKVAIRDADADIDVNLVARKLGGGGHVRAAGARVPMNIPDTKKAVVDAIIAARTGR